MKKALGSTKKVLGKELTVDDAGTPESTCPWHRNNSGRRDIGMGSALMCP